jgi:hypothetical protein
MKKILFLIGVEIGADEMSERNTPAAGAPAPVAKRI